MMKTLRQVYDQYLKSKEYEMSDQSVYEGAKEEASAVLKEVLPPGSDTAEVDGVIGIAMENAHRQGFYDGFKFTAKLGAECFGNQNKED